MALSSQKFREIVFQLLFSHDFADVSMKDISSLVMTWHHITQKNLREVQEKFEFIWKKHDEIDRKIAQYSQNYSFERITRIEKAILRLSVYEILYSDLPPQIIISEAIRLTKKFATTQGASYINALLDIIYKEKGSAKSISAK